MVWFAMAIPVLTALVLFVLFKHRTVWWEFFIPVGVSALLIFICKTCTETLQTLDKEYWGGWVTKAEYYEEWDERVPCRHPKYKAVTRTRSDGSTYTEWVFDGYEHLYDVDYHSPYWQVSESNGYTLSVNSNRFDELAMKFGNKKKVDLGRSYHSIDGDKWVATWKGSDETLEPVVTIHSYENRVQASDSIFNFPEVNPEEYGLFEYPRITDYYRCPSILGNSGPAHAEANRLLDIWNAKLGAMKQVRIWILVFVDKPYDTALKQEAYWKGGNKNEFIVAIGVDKQRAVKWCYAFSWTEVEQLKVEARNFVIQQKELDLVKVVEWLGPEIQKKFVRKQFADFSYITVEPPLWAVILIFLITIAVNVGVSAWIVYNEFHEESRRRFNSYY